MIMVPSAFMQVRYNGKQIPGSGQPIFESGANCQLFAYTLLEKNGTSIPPFRSSELWTDNEHTSTVKGGFMPGDLMLYHDHPEAWGAHVGLYIGDNQVIHLSKENGLPEIIDHGQIQKNPRYTHFIGAKRPKGNRLTDL